MLSGLERDKLFLQLVAEGRYSVSEEGVIRKYYISKDGSIKNKEGKVIGNWNTNFVIIGKERNYFSITRTRAAWLMFNGLIPEVEGDQYFVTFKEKNKPFHVSNLQLKLQKELSSEQGKKSVTRLDPRAGSKLKEDQVLELRREFVANPKDFVLRQRAKQLGVTHATLSAALSGKTFANVADPVPKDLMKKPGGNKRPRVWDRKTCPSYLNRPSRAKPISEQVIKRIVPKTEKPKAVKPINNVVPFKKPVTSSAPKVLTEQQKQEKVNRLEMMKRIGQKLARAKNFD